MSEFVPAESNVLLLGSGTGRLCDYLKNSKKCYVTGLDVSASKTRSAAATCSKVYTTDLDEQDALDVLTELYNVVLLPGTIEHLVAPNHLLQRTHQLLFKPGLVILSLHNLAHWKVRLNLLSGKFDYGGHGVLNKHHTRIYTLRG